MWFVLSLQYGRHYGTTKKLYLISQERLLDRTTPNYSCESDFCCLFKFCKDETSWRHFSAIFKKAFSLFMGRHFPSQFYGRIGSRSRYQMKKFFFLYERYWSSQLLLTPSSNFRLLTSFTSLRKLLLYIFQWGSGQH